jgi:hypothetical protein
MTVSEPVLQSVITCPQCGFAQEETMPVDACLFLYDCPNCQALLKPKSGDCCVFCSYGSVKCPPVQQPISTPDDGGVASTCCGHRAQTRE